LLFEIFPPQIAESFQNKHIERKHSETDPEFNLQYSQHCPAAPRLVARLLSYRAEVA